MVWAGSLGINRLDTFALVAQDVSYYSVLQALRECELAAKVATAGLLEVGLCPLHGQVDRHLIEGVATDAKVAFVKGISHVMIWLDARYAEQ